MSLPEEQLTWLLSTVPTYGANGQKARARSYSRFNRVGHCKSFILLRVVRDSLEVPHVFITVTLLYCDPEGSCEYTQ